jgi:hypothetical protein
MTDQWKRDYDRLEAFKQKVTGIDILISGLKGLLSTLEVRDEQWIDRVFEEWGNLEILYALACERAEADGVDASANIKELFNSPSANDATSKIEALVHERLSHV